MALKFLGYEVNEGEFLTQEIIDTWERVFNENNGTVTPVESTGDNLFYFKDTALGDNWVLGWVLDSNKNLFQFGPVTKAFALIPEAKTFRERFGIKIDKIENPPVELSYEYTSNKEDLERDWRGFNGFNVQKAGQGVDELGRPYTDYKGSDGNIVLRVTLVDDKKDEEEVKFIPIREYTSDKEVFVNTKEYGVDNDTFHLSEEGNDELGRPVKKFTDEDGRVRLIFTLIEAKNEEPKEEDKKDETESDVVIESMSILVNGIEITKVDGFKLPPKDRERTKEEGKILEIAESYEENLKDRIWEEYEDGKVLVTDYLSSDQILDENGNAVKAIVRSNIVFVNVPDKALAGHSIVVDNLSSRQLANSISKFIEERLAETLISEKTEETPSTKPEEEL